MKRFLSILCLGLAAVVSATFTAHAADYTIKAGSTDVTVYMTLQFFGDYETNQSPATGFAYNTSDLRAYYVRTRGAATPINLVSQTVTGTHVDGGFKELDATNMPGVYRLDLPDAACATGAANVRVTLFDGADGKLLDVIDIDLVAYDPADGNRLGLAYLPSAAPGSTNGLLTYGTGTGQVNANNGIAAANIEKVQGDPVDEMADYFVSRSLDVCPDAPITAVNSSVEFEIGSGPYNNDALNGATAILQDLGTGQDRAIGLVKDYFISGGNRHVVLEQPLVGMALGDAESVRFVAGGTLPIDRTVLLSTKISTVTNQTRFVSADFATESDDLFTNCLAMIGDTSTGEQCARMIVDHLGGANYRIDIDSPPPFQVVAGDTIKIIAIPPAIAAILDDTGTSGVKIEPDGIKPSTIQNDAFTAAKFAGDAIDEIQDGLSTFDPAADEVTVGTNNDKTDYALSSTSIAGIWNAATSGMNTDGSIGERIVDNLNAVVGNLPPQSYFDALFNGAPTFAQAMDDQGYTMDLAEKLERSAPTLLVSTAIVGMPTSNTEFVLASGPDENDALKGALVIVTRDGATPKKAVGLVKHYIGMTKEVELITDPEMFAFAEDDKVDVIATGSPAALWLGGSP